MENEFANAPTVGSNDHVSTMAQLQAENAELKERLTRLEAQQQRPAEEERPRKFKWKKVRKFFKAFIKPILDFIPRLINALANHKEAVAKVQNAATEAQKALAKTQKATATA